MKPIPDVGSYTNIRNLLDWVYKQSKFSFYYCLQECLAPDSGELVCIFPVVAAKITTRKLARALNDN